MKGIEFWGYLHVNGDLIVKRALWTYDEDIRDAEGSPFVKRVFKKIEVSDRDEAITKFKEIRFKELLNKE